MKHLFTRYLRGINPPYNRKAILALSITFFIILAIPLTLFTLSQHTAFEQHAAGPEQQAIDPAYISAMGNMGYHLLRNDEYLLTQANSGKPAKGKSAYIYKFKNGLSLKGESDQTEGFGILDGDQPSQIFVNPDEESVVYNKYALADASGVKLKPDTKGKKSERPVCGTPSKKHVKCLAHVVTDESGIPLSGPTPAAAAMTPQQFHAAYQLPCTPGGSVQGNCATPTVFGGQTIGIVDAFNSPNVEQDLATFSTQYHLPPCNKANGCLTVVNQSGGSTLPSTDQGWALEITLDVQTAHSICQTCKILLVEANSASITDLGSAVNEAVSLGATEVSNSYGTSEFSSQTSFDSYYTHPNVAITASTGDWGYGSYWPASSSNVIAVGGTALSLNADNSWKSETVWSDSGSGCSAYEKANPWQTALPNWSTTGCGGMRAASDVAADAAPSSGASIYDSTPYNGGSGWYQVGGTSLSSPLIASVIALAGGASGYANASQIPYLYSSSTNSHDVTVGSDGTCTTIMCTAGTGYDGPTGIGTPNGISGYGLYGGSIIQSPTYWQVTNDPSQQSNTFNQTFAASTADSSINTVSVAFSPSLAGVSVTFSKSILSLGAGAKDSFTATVTINNNQAKAGYYLGQLVYTSNGASVGVTPIILVINPSLTTSPSDLIDFGIDDPSQTSWTSGSKIITVTNLRKDIPQTVSISSSSLPAGATLQNTPSSITIPAGSTMTFTSQINADNTKVANGVYNGTLILTSPVGSITQGVSFTKYYVLHIVDANTADFTNATGWITSNGLVIALSTGAPKGVFLNNPGIYNIAIKYPSQFINTTSYAEYYVFKEGVTVTGGLTTVTVSRSDAKNAMTMSPTDPTGGNITALPHELAAVRDIPDNITLSAQWSLGANSLTNYYSNMGSNFSVQREYQISDIPSKNIQYYYANATNLSGNQTITNSINDFQSLQIQYNTDTPQPIIPYVYSCLSTSCTTFIDSSSTISTPGLLTIFSLANPSDGASFQTTYQGSGGFGTYGTETSPNFTTASPPQRWIKSLSWTSNGVTPDLSPVMLPSMTERVVYNGLGPSYYAMKFQNTPTQINPIPYEYPSEAIFLRQDYSMKSYSGVATQLYAEPGDQPRSGNGGLSYDYWSDYIPHLYPYSVSAAGMYKFVVTGAYTDSGKIMNAKAVNQFNTSLSDPNPPAFTRFYYYSNNARAEVYDPTVANRLEFSLDPEGGSISTVGVSYAIDGTTFQSLTVNNPANNIYSVEIPGNLTNLANNILTLQISTVDNSSNSLSYTFQLPVGAAPTPPVPTVTPILSPSPTPTLVILPTASPSPTPTLSPTPTFAPTPTLTPTPTIYDSIPPTVLITNPLNGSSVARNSTITIIASATDNIGIAKVLFYINGSLKCTDAASPYTCSLKVNGKSSTVYTLKAVAYDLSNNTATSTVTITSK